MFLRMTEAQKKWMDDHPQYTAIGWPRPGILFDTAGTLYCDGRFDPIAPMKPIKLEPGCFGVGIPRIL